MKIYFPLLLISFFLLQCQTNSAATQNSSPYPEHWWKPVLKEGTPSWEILPQEARPGEVILSKRNELGLLSNFAATPFELDGKHYASVEGFWQMLKYPENPKDERFNPKIKWPFTREQVAAMTAFDAKKAGKIASENMKALSIDWVTYNGQKLIYHAQTRGDFYNLILRAEWAKLRQNENVRNILLSTGDLKLRPDHIEEADAAPAWRYYEMWMEIREQIRR